MSHVTSLRRLDSSSRVHACTGRDTEPFVLKLLLCETPSSYINSIQIMARRTQATSGCLMRPRVVPLPSMRPTPHYSSPKLQLESSTRDTSPHVGRSPKTAEDQKVSVEKTRAGFSLPCCSTLRPAKPAISFGAACTAAGACGLKMARFEALDFPAAPPMAILVSTTVGAIYRVGWPSPHRLIGNRSLVRDFGRKLQSLERSTWSRLPSRKGPRSPVAVTDTSVFSSPWTLIFPCFSPPSTSLGHSVRITSILPNAMLGFPVQCSDDQQNRA